MNPRKPTLSRPAFLLLLVGAVFCLVTLYWSFQAYTEAIETDPVIPTVGVIAVADVTTDQIAAAYQENEIAADQQFQNKVIIVRGAISDIGRSDDGSPFVRLASATAPGSSPVICAFAADASAALAQMRIGQFVTVKGLCIGRVRRVYINMVDCVLL